MDHFPPPSNVFNCASDSWLKARGDGISMGTRRWLVTVRFSELDEQIALFELGAYDDPRGPKHVEEELIG